MDKKEFRKLYDSALAAGCIQADIAALLMVPTPTLHGWMEGTLNISEKRATQLQPFQAWVARGCPGVVEWRDAKRPHPNPAGVEPIVPGRVKRHAIKKRKGKPVPPAETTALVVQTAAPTAPDAQIYALLEAFDASEQRLRVQHALKFALEHVDIPRKQAVAFATLLITALQRIGPLDAKDFTSYLRSSK